MGYTDVYAFIGGIPEWRGFQFPMTVNEEMQKIRVRKIPPVKVLDLIKEKDLFVLDVRPAKFERDQTFIKGTVQCPLVELADRYKKIPKDRQIVITDWHMKQSISAAKFLIANGYRVIGVLKGGIKRWKLEDFPVKRREQVKPL